MDQGQGLLDEFERYVEFYLTPEQNIYSKINREKDKIVFEIKKRSVEGYDFGATIEVYGIYPWAGEWHGAPWEPMQGWSVEKVCKDYFGFVRMLLSEDAQLRCIYRHGKLSKAQIRLHDTNEWRLFEEVGFAVIPYGKKEEKIYQNNDLVTRYPYPNIQSNEWGMYYWEKPTNKSL